MLNQVKRVYLEFPTKFWIVVLTSFIDGLGGTLLFPFASLYITQKFGVGMTTAGFILGMFSFFGLFSNMAGGALTDKFGRRRLILFGLVASGLSSLLLGLVTELWMFYPLAVVVGLLMNIAAPAQSAMIADILPESKRQEGFGVLRIAGNMAWIIGPMLGGFIAAKSFIWLFVGDAVSSLIVAVMFFVLMPETRSQEAHEKVKGQSLMQTAAGYINVLRDAGYTAFIIASTLMGLVYFQMYNSLSVYLRDEHRITTEGYGLLLTTTAITVVLFQFSVSRFSRRRPPFLMMALGTFFFMLGFSMFGFVGDYLLFILAMVIVTFGEMLVMPVSQALVANFAPEDMRGRYVAVYSLAWSIPSIIGPGAAGIILDHFDPNLLWYIGGGLCAVSALWFAALHLRLGANARFKLQAEKNN